MNTYQQLITQQIPTIHQSPLMIKWLYSIIGSPMDFALKQKNIAQGIDSNNSIITSVSYWNNTATYNIGDLVSEPQTYYQTDSSTSATQTKNGYKVYISTTNNNVGNKPFDFTNNWLLVTNLWYGAYLYQRTNGQSFSLEYMLNLIFQSTFRQPNENRYKQNLSDISVRSTVVDANLDDFIVGIFEYYDSGVGTTQSNRGNDATTVSGTTSSVGITSESQQSALSIITIQNGVYMPLNYRDIINQLLGRFAPIGSKFKIVRN